MKKILLLFVIAAFIGCLKNREPEGEKIIDYKEYSMTVASKKLQGVVGNGHSILREVYAVKIGTSQEWTSFWGIQDFEYEAGYEYVIKISETAYLDYRLGDPAWTEYKLINIASKEKKDSEGLPEHLIPDWYEKQH